MAYKSKFKGKEIDDKLDLVQKLSEDISDIKEDIKNTIKEETDTVFSNSPAASITEEKKAEWDNKVDKVSGKQLSTEDFTTILKTKLEGLSNYDDTELSKALSTLRGDFNKLVSGDTTTAIKTFNEIIAFLDGIQDSQDLSSIIASIEQQITAKQDRITDLDAIRRGAEKGTTAVQPSSLADYISKDDVDAELSETSTNPIQNQAVMNTLLTWEEVLGGILEQKQPVISDLEAIRDGAAKGAASLQYTEVSEEIDDVETDAQVGKTAFDTFMDNIDVDYAYDSSTGANYTVIRVYKTKLDGTKQYPFVVVPDVNEIKYSTLDFMENFADDNGYLFAINSGLGSPATHKIDGIAVQNGVVVNNEPAVYHAGSMPLTIDANGDLSYATSSANANELVASGIVSAICGFCPIIVDYNTVSPPTVSNVSHFTQNAQRQIIGQFGNGDYAIITCEGRNFNNSDGWTIAEAQTICKKLGLKFAYNLDGGGSTQTVIGKKQLNIIYENEKGRTLPSFIVFNGRSELGVMPDIPDVQVTLESISATYSGGDVEVGTDLATLTGVVVTATYSDGSTVTVSDYTLSGEIAEGENVITVSYRDKTTTFTIVGITGNISGQLVWVIGTTDSGGTWAGTPENHRGALYTTENTGSIVALDIDGNSAVNAFNVPSGLTGKLYLPRIPEGVTKLSWSNSDSNVLEAVWLRDSSGTKIAEVGTSYGMASPIDLTKYPTAVYWNCDCKYGQKNAKIYANPDNGDSEAYNRYQVVCNTKFTFS